MLFEDVIGRSPKYRSIFSSRKSERICCQMIAEINFSPRCARLSFFAPPPPRLRRGGPMRVCARQKRTIFLKHVSKSKRGVRDVSSFTCALRFYVFPMRLPLQMLTIRSQCACSDICSEVFCLLYGASTMICPWLPGKVY